MIEAWQELRGRLFGILQKVEPVANQEKLKRRIPSLKTLLGSFRYASWRIGGGADSASPKG
ncbi:hypothetical protein COO91_04956 [Nostoc flagelliforme CCNUN1]|uniref:Transposase n=1 Tax=Nostoc flagelliforme CCNUN1 TaxID=2038116 RepID=A0A2K8SU38_9NOSO|nr:hypothetical protein [Nostoc flagelliforme]AUB38976.1 hypothetical protein COO91_04956 [Nostoc flagelliforme CCNUN1]